MRTIVTKKDPNRNKQLALGGLLIVVMFGSVFGIVVNSFGQKEDTKKIEYNGYEFIEQGGLWYTNIGDLNFVFINNPKETEKINSKVSLLSSYSGKPLYIYSENKEAETEIFRNLHPQVNPIIQRMQFACPSEEECEDDSPIKTCENNFIIIKEANKTNIAQEEGCVFIYGPKENLTMITDEFLFKMLGIEQ